MRLALHLTVVVLVVLAGCGGSTGPGPAQPTAEESTPTPVPPPAGLSTDSVTDARTLTESHLDALDGNSYTADLQRTVRYENGTVYSRTNATHRVGADGTAWGSVRVDGARPLFLGGVAGGIETWTNESVSVSEITTADGSTYQRGVERRGPASFSAVYAVFESLDLVTTGHTGVGAETRYHLATAEPSETNAFGLGGAPARNTTLAAAVDGDGVLRHYELSYTTEVRGETVRVTRTMRVDGVGETTVRRPDWVDEALSETKNQPR